MIALLKRTVPSSLKEKEKFQNTGKSLIIINLMIVKFLFVWKSLMIICLRDV